MRRARSAKIVATLGPSTSHEQAIHALFERGVDVFRLNFSHGTQSDHAQRLQTIRALEQEAGRPIGVLLDLQGPKLRLGTFEGGRAQLDAGVRLRLDMDQRPGDARRALLLHPEIFAALQTGTELLLDDGKLRLRVDSHGADFAETTVLVGGPISDRKGVNVPSVLLPISPLTAKDRDDLAFGLALGVDWVALSFVQRPQDIEEARALIGTRAWIVAKLEKPAAIEHLDGIVALSDGIMVGARRPRRRAAAGAGAGVAAPHRARLPQGRQAGGGGDADARIDDRGAGAHPCRGLRRRHRDLRRRATPALRATSRSRFPKCLGELPLLLPTQDMALRNRIDQWLEERSIRPRIIGEFADSGLIATFGVKGMGAFPATAWSREDLTRRQGLKLLGPSPEVADQFFAISAERKVQDPLVQMILTQRIE